MKIAILASGRGSNAKAIFGRAKRGGYKNAEFVALISDKPDAPALQIAKDFGVKALYLDTKKTGARFSEEGASDYISALKSLGADMVVLAGFMKILPAEFVSAFENRIINLHPSLLPAFKGKDAIKQAFDFGAKVCGCTVHFVDNKLDGGEIIAQKAVYILPEYDLCALEEKVHEAEHELLPQVVADVCEGKIKIGK